MKKLLLLIALVSTASCQSNVGVTGGIANDSEDVAAARTICIQVSSGGLEGFEGAFDVVIALVTGAQRDGIPREAVIDVLVGDCATPCSVNDDATTCENRCSACVTAVVDAVY